MRCTTASPLSPFVLEPFFFFLLFFPLHRCLSSLTQSKHAEAHSWEGKKNSYREMSALKLAEQRGSRTGHKSPLNGGHNKRRPFGRPTAAVIDIGSNQKCDAHFCQRGDVWNGPPFHRGPHAFHTLGASANPEAPVR